MWAVVWLDRSKAHVGGYGLQIIEGLGQGIKGPPIRSRREERGGEFGVGLSTGQGSDPQIMMRFSDDGGFTWSPDRRASIGRMGVRLIRAMWDRLGTFRQRTVEISVSDPVKRCFYGMRTNVRPLAR